MKVTLNKSFKSYSYWVYCKSTYAYSLANVVGRENRPLAQAIVSAHILTKVDFIDWTMTKIFLEASHRELSNGELFARNDQEATDLCTGWTAVLV